MTLICEAPTARLAGIPAPTEAPPVEVSIEKRSFASRTWPCVRPWEFGPFCAKTVMVATNPNVINDTFIRFIICLFINRLDINPSFWIPMHYTSIYYHPTPLSAMLLITKPLCCSKKQYYVLMWITWLIGIGHALYIR